MSLFNERNKALRIIMLFVLCEPKVRFACKSIVFFFNVSVYLGIYIYYLISQKKERLKENRKQT
jgi:hypothetical protein